MIAMQSYRILISKEASSDLDDMAEYVAGICHLEFDTVIVDRVLPSKMMIK